MKRLCALLLVALFFVLVGCSNVKEGDITDFTAWLDSEGFTPSISQRDMIEKMGGYTYNGQPFDASCGIFYDSLYGGGYTVYGEEFGFTNDYCVSEDRKTADYTNLFYTKVPLGGLTLPLGIEFADTFQDVLLKMGITEKLPSEFGSDEGTDAEMTLYKNERYTLVFRNLYLSKDLNQVDIPYELVFTEKYTFTDERKGENNVTRTIKLTFEPNEKVLHEFSVTIQENYKLK